MRFLIIFAIVFTLSFFALDQNVFASVDCNDPHCYTQIKTDRNTNEHGLEYDLETPDLWIDRTLCENIAVSTGWLIADGLEKNFFVSEWVETGITTGNVELVGCVTELRTYYGFQDVDGDFIDYQEFLVNGGRVDPRDDVKVNIEYDPALGIDAEVETPDGIIHPYRIQLDPENVYHVDIGIEGTVSATDEYSSIPMSKFTNMKIKQNGSWINMSSDSPLFNTSSDEGYIGIKCPSSNGLIAGSIMEINNDFQEIDCNNVAVRNQAAIVDNQVIEISVQEDRIIFLNDVDTDQDYLHYYLVSNPTKGMLNYTNINDRIPNTDGDSSQIVYTPASSPPENDSFRYSVKDERTGHTREVLISIIGPIPAPTIPDPEAVDTYLQADINTLLAWEREMKW